jgi:hypothetical protein
MKTPPSDAGWRKGDVIRNSAPSPGEPFGWVCAGLDPTTQKPGWMAFGRIGSPEITPWPNGGKVIGSESAVDGASRQFVKKRPDRMDP